MAPIRLCAATGDAVARVDIPESGQPEVAINLEGRGAQCVAVDPHDPHRGFVGTFDDGLYQSLDGGETWHATGADIHERRVLSVAISPSDRVNGRSVVFVGTEPSNVYRSEDDGQTWRPSPRLMDLPSATTWSFPPRPWTHHVRWIAPHDHDPALLFVGIELGGVMCSRDGGETWEDRKPGSYHDAHAVLTHPGAPERVYEAAGNGVALSTDLGVTWEPVDDGMDRHYAWGLAVDSADPDRWYVSAAPGPRQAHGAGDPRAVLYRRDGDASWRPLPGPDGTSPDWPSMPYALLAPRDHPNWLFSGLRNGMLYLSQDGGETWDRLDIQLTGLLALNEARG
jgi:photosystem II stability/assembly factor-like uncharacterized protein